MAGKLGILLSESLKQDSTADGSIRWTTVEADDEVAEYPLCGGAGDRLRPRAGSLYDRPLMRPAGVQW